MKEKTDKQTKIAITPLGDRVIVEPLKNEKQTASGIILTGNDSKENPGVGIVVAVGPGRTDDSGKVTPVSVQVGDKVVFSKYSPEEIKVDGVDYYVLREESLLAILK